MRGSQHFEIDNDDGDHAREYSTHQGYQSAAVDEVYVEVTHHPRLLDVERALRKFYLSVFVSLCLVAVASTFASNLKNGLFPSMAKEQAMQQHKEEPTSNLSEISLGEQEGGHLEVLDSGGIYENEVITKNTAVQANPLDGYDCVDDRLSNNVSLKRGQFLCASKNSYIVGILDGPNFISDDNFGDFIWRHVPTEETRIYHAQAEPLEPYESFVLTTEGVWKLLNESGDTVWSLEPQTQRLNLAPIGFTEHCLKDYNCPYLHLHGDGVMVLNWIQDHVNPNDGQLEHDWNEKDILKLYDLKKRNRITLL